MSRTASPGIVMLNEVKHLAVVQRTASPGIVMLNEMKHLAAVRQTASRNAEILPFGQNDIAFR